MDKKPTTTEFTAQQPNPVRQARLHRHRGREDSLKQPEKHVIADKFAQRAAKVVFFAGLGVAPSKKDSEPRYAIYERGAGCGEHSPISCQAPSKSAPIAAVGCIFTA
jgi:hypothetical protein